MMGGNDSDEFGDASFLQDFDVDSFVRQAETATRNAPPSSSSTTTIIGDLPSRRNEDRENGKRRKISDSAATEAGMETSPSASSSSPSSLQQELQQTLRNYFGYSEFRSGQWAVLQQLLEFRRDVVVFWATGQGKSLCYQLPALYVAGAGAGAAAHTPNTTSATSTTQKSKTVLVISPLVSLMQDQVHKLNALVSSHRYKNRNEIATYLGSAQTDATVEQRLRDYALIFVTPEKLLAPGFIEKFTQQITQDQLALIAIDEAHCISEYGYDFRPEFRKVGRLLRRGNSTSSSSSSSWLSQVPLLALTATAVPRVRQDIVESLQLREPFISSQSLDRPNLRLRVSPRHGGIGTAMQPVLHRLQQQQQQQNGNTTTASSSSSTIIYAPTRSQVEEIAHYLQSRLEHGHKIVQAYHAGLSTAERAQAHTQFLTGQTTVIVATVAFGMGIDKPDTRCIVHYGPPKTMEEYYQQIGRAGRDGLWADCHMYCQPSDFDRYQSDFYLGSYSTPAARRAVEASTAALQRYSSDSVTCRRVALLEYLGDTTTTTRVVKDAWRCGVCDNCQALQTYGVQGTQRDFGPAGARLLLEVLARLKPQSWSTIGTVVMGGITDQYRYRPGANPVAVQTKTQQWREQLPRKYPQTYFRDLIPPLTQEGYLVESKESRTVNGFHRSWTTYALSEKGWQALSDPSQPIVLPVPESVREAERVLEEQRQQVLQELHNRGIPRDKLPPKEVEQGDGPVIRAYSKWHAHVQNHRQAGRMQRVAELEDLLLLLQNWQSAVAVQQRVAPVTVVPEHVLVSVAYLVATLPPTQVCHLQADALAAAGIRGADLNQLLQQLQAWVQKVQPAGPDNTKGPANNDNDAAPMVLGVIQPTKPWSFARYKPQKKTGKMVWELSYDRFVQGESIPTIAMTPSSGRQPIQAKTVVGHLLDAILHGRPLDLRPLADYMPAPTQSQWEQLDAACADLDVAGDPDNSNKKLILTDCIRPIVGDRLADLPYPERNEEEKALLIHWFDALKWYLTLRRVGYEPAFGSKKEEGNDRNSPSPAAQEPNTQVVNEASKPTAMKSQ